MHYQCRLPVTNVSRTKRPNRQIISKNLFYPVQDVFPANVSLICTCFESPNDFFFSSWSVTCLSHLNSIHEYPFQTGHTFHVRMKCSYPQALVHLPKLVHYWERGSAGHVSRNVAHQCRTGFICRWIYVSLLWTSEQYGKSIRQPCPKWSYCKALDIASHCKHRHDVYCKHPCKHS